MTGLDTDLAALADAHGVAVRYTDARSQPVDVPATTVRHVLRAMDVPVDDPCTALRAAQRARQQRLVDSTVVVMAGGTFSTTADEAVVAGVALRVVDGTVRLPPEVQTGAHDLYVRSGAREQRAHLLVVPPRCPVPRDLRTWGWQIQLYALRSRASWGIGDLGDLRRLAGGSLGADFILLNPLHAALPVLPQEPSPYYPASRRFVNPLYLRVEDCDGYTGPDVRWDNTSERIDRDTVFRAKLAALEPLAAQPLPERRRAAFETYRAAEGHGLVDFATAAALAERHGRSFHDWPAELRDPRGAAVAAVRAELADRVALHEWLQWQCDEQLAAAARAARAAGMAVGLITDLAVGVDPGGADAWALQADLAQGVTVGAPPDPFNQQGQDWRLPPLRPDRLAATGYAPLRDLLRSQLRHAGGIRIDHVMGLLRLFWIPEGAAARDGTYVRYPADALLGVLALEAEAAGALVIGEDLGTVEPGVRERLRERAVLSSRVLWFERDEDGRRRRSAQYPALALTTVTTHDLPTAAGFLADEPTRVRAALGQPADGLDEERDELIALLVEEGFLAPGADRDEIVAAMHTFIAATPSMLVAVGLGDAVGDLRQPNLPGTIDEYPNWRLPVAEPAGEPRGNALLPPSRPLLLEELLDSPGVARLAAVLAQGRRARAVTSVDAPASYKQDLLHE